MQVNPHCIHRHKGKHNARGVDPEVEVAEPEEYVRRHDMEDLLINKWEIDGDERLNHGHERLHIEVASEQFGPLQAEDIDEKAGEVENVE